MRTLRDFYEEYEWAVGFASLALALGGGGVVLKVVGSIFDLDLGWKLSLFAVSAGALWLALQYLPPPGQSKPAAVQHESTPIAGREPWESRIEVSNDANSITCSLKSRIGAQVTRGFACDVRNPAGGIPARAATNKGLTDGLWFVYPDDFGVAMSGLIPGTYSVTWYEMSEDWEWVERLRDEIEVPRAEPPGRAFGRRAAEP